jgi:hypothetical protein
LNEALPKEASESATASDALPNLAIGTLRLPIKNLLNRIAVSNPLQYPQSFQKITFAARIRPDENIQRTEIERHLLQTLEALDLDVLDHA